MNNEEYKRNKHLKFFDKTKEILFVIKELIPGFLDLITSHNKLMLEELIKKYQYCLKDCFKEYVVSESKLSEDLGDVWSITKLLEKTTKIANE